MYIDQVNATNLSLQRNLDQSIKAGDITNAQKVHLLDYDRAEKCSHDLLKKIRDTCKRKNPGCKCSDDKHDSCPIYQEFIIAAWMNDLKNGSVLAWKMIFEYASAGRKLAKGFPTPSAYSLVTDVNKEGGAL